MTSQPGSAIGPEAFDPAKTRFVLLQPRSAGNVGSAARALKNLGFSRLTLVRPRCDPQGDEARRLAVDATDLLERAEVHDDLDQALGGAATVVGTTARTGRHRRPHWRLDEFAQIPFPAAAERAVLFGREDRGMTDRELDRCTHLVYLPAVGNYTSFNLAHAVLLFAYQMRLTGSSDPAPATFPPAGHRTREAMYRHTERALLAIGFIRAETREVIMRRFRRMLGRASLSADEVQLLRGIARQTLWAADRAGLEIPPAEADDAG